MIVNLIDSYMTGRGEFQLTCGTQPSCVLLYLTEGSFSFETAEGSFLVRAGDVVILDTVTQMMRHVLDPIRFLYVKFEPCREEIYAIKTCVLHAVNGRIKDDVLQIQALCEVRTRLGLKMREHYLNDLFLCLMQTPPVESQEEHLVPLPKGFAEPIAYMKAHIKDGLTLEELSRACGRSVSSLESDFREMFGVSLYRYFINLRMERAEELLTKTSYTVTEIATRCGYENLFYFCNAFKKHCGVSPTEYRRSHLI